MDALGDLTHAVRTRGHTVVPPLTRGGRRRLERARREGRRAAVASALSAALVPGVVGVILVVVGLTVAGVRPMVIRSGSMVPTLHVGDLVISRSEPVTSLEPGQMVTFRLPHHGRLLTHRVRHLDRSGGEVSVETRGDANDVSEFWTVPDSARVGRVVATAPGIGWAFMLMSTFWARAALILALCAWVLGAGLRRLWATTR